MGFCMASATEVWLTQAVLQLLAGHEKDAGGPQVMGIRGSCL